MLMSNLRVLEKLYENTIKTYKDRPITTQYSAASLDYPAALLLQGRQHLRCLPDEIPRAACYMGSYEPVSYSSDLSGRENDSRAAE